jgi:hypothetical protein
VSQRIYAFRACRCFRKDSRRVISALAARTASAPVGLCFCSGVLFTLTVGLVGRTWVGNIEGRLIGCVVIGPVAGLSLGIAGWSLARYFVMGEVAPHFEPISAMLSLQPVLS